MGQQYKYLYGPVPSRRLGRSLGIDIVPPKICTLDCVYCQIGRTTQKTLERAEYVPVDEVAGEVKLRLAEGLEADFLTIGGSGEPTLNSRLGRLIDQIKGLTDIPVAVLTNGSLLYEEEVRQACAKADVVLPSLDAPDSETFEKVNRPQEGLGFDRFLGGLCEFRRPVPWSESSPASQFLLSSKRWTIPKRPWSTMPGRLCNAWAWVLRSFSGPEAQDPYSPTNSES